MRQGHIPLGYRIENGKAVISGEDAEKVKRIFAGYLAGLSMKKAAESVGWNLKHSSVKHIMQNMHYLGDEFYPAIIERETFDAAENERIRRGEALGRDKLPKKEQITKRPIKKFRMGKAEQTFSDPYKQAEYIYSLIESEEQNGNC